MTCAESSLTSCGESAAKSGLKPLNRTVRSSAGWVRASGIVPPSGSGVASPGSCVSATYRSPTRLRYLMVAAVPCVRVEVRSTSKVTSALTRSFATRMSFTVPTRTPAMRTSWPLVRPVTSVNSAR